MGDTQNFDTSEKIDILLKQAFGFPCTSEKKSYYEELYTKFNTYFFLFTSFTFFHNIYIIN